MFGLTHLHRRGAARDSATQDRASPATFFRLSAALFAVTALLWVGSGQAATSIGSMGSMDPVSTEADDSQLIKTTAADAFRLLTQASFGPTLRDLNRVQAMGIPAYLENQFAQPVSGYPDSQYTYLSTRLSADCNNKDPSGNAYPASAPQAICYRDNLTPAGVQRQFFTNAMTQPDQL